MSLDTAKAIAGLRSLTQKFDAGRESADPFYPTIATVVNSDGKDEEYGGLGSVPGVREWVGDRVFNSLRGAKFTIENRKWESSIQVEKDDIDDARLVKYGPVLEELGAEAECHPDELMFELLVNGESQTCLDGQYFFDTDHAWGDSGTQSNDLTSVAATGTTPTEAECRTAYHAARAAMLGFKKDNGKFFHRPTLSPVSDFLLLVPPQHEVLWDAALTKPYIANGESNFIKDAPRVIASPYLSADKFYLLRTGQKLKPFIFQKRQDIRRQMKGDQDREFKDVKFMTDARYAAGYLAWWNACLTTWT